ncbi:MAG: Asp-tRNA(Asn)/Glu-tRNA(Gln) amidotransferase subunit GatC [bacterium]|nr:Asp-tRNA(Asn)/Glu-tRNA(Gln) amidotransferase subunit GatC [bacterium]
MAERITMETIQNIGILAKLELSQEEAQKAREEMQKMLDYVEKLKELDTDNIEPMSHIFPVFNVFREDVVTNTNEREAMLANAPKEQDGQFVVPKTIGES